MKNTVYWASTLLVSVLMAATAFAYLGHLPKTMAAFSAAGYPASVAGFLGVAKLLGVIVLLVPGLPLLKEWAYAGFTFMCIGAGVSLLFLHQSLAVTVPVMALFLVLTSYFTRPSTRRLSFGYRFEFY